MIRLKNIRNSHVALTLVLMGTGIGAYLAWDFYEGLNGQRPVAISAQEQTNLGQVALQGPVLPVESPRLDPDKVKLGEMLFHDPRLSGRGQESCAVCHGLSRGGIGTDSSSGFNISSIFNVGLNGLYGWTGQNISLEVYTDRLIEDPNHMKSNWDRVVVRLQDDSNYQQLFSISYPDGISRKTVTDALVSFQESLVTPNSPFDRFLKGDKLALGEDEKAGYRLFSSYGCVACHQGANLGGNVFAKLGLFKDYPFSGSDEPSRDAGLMMVTGDTADAHVFRVPGLRNVAVTAPYFHDGSVATLESAIRQMALYQGGRDIPESDVTLIMHFLSTLTGEYQGRSL